MRSYDYREAYGLGRTCVRHSSKSLGRAAKMRSHVTSTLEETIPHLGWELLPVAATEIGFLPGERRLLRQLRSCGRAPSLRALAPTLESAQGTAIVDYPTMSWAHWRLWWTPTDIAATRPMAPPQDYIDDPFSRAVEPSEAWLFEHQLHPTRGKALLLGVWFPWRVAKQFLGLRRNIPAISIRSYKAAWISLGTFPYDEPA